MIPIGPSKSNNPAALAISTFHASSARIVLAFYYNRYSPRPFTLTDVQQEAATELNPHAVT